MPRKEKTSQPVSFVLRVCRSDFTSHDGFKWPSQIGETVEAPDWKDEKTCGYGLHGWLHGQGEHDCVDYWRDKDAKWLVLEVPTADIVMLGGKCKFPRVKVAFIGSMRDAAAYIAKKNTAPAAVIGHSIIAGDNEAAAVGALGTATAGYRGTAIAGDGGTAIAGDGGTATAGYGGTATAGYGGTAIAGDRGTATAGYWGTAAAGEKGEIRIKYYDGRAERYRTAIGYIGENGLLPSVKYHLNEQHEFVSEEQATEAGE